MIFVTLVVGAISDDSLNMKSSLVNYILANHGKWLWHIIMGQTIIDLVLQMLKSLD